MDLPPHRPPRGEPLRCPLDGTRLVELERNDVLIDACPECRGVWLDRGELDRILERDRRALVKDPDEDFYAEMGGQRSREPQRPAPPPQQHYDKRYDKKRRRKSMLEELFDFD